MRGLERRRKTVLISDVVSSPGRTELRGRKKDDTGSLYSTGRPALSIY